MKLKHAYIREGEEPPVHPTFVAHIAGREDGTGLDIWWWEMDDPAEYGNPNHPANPFRVDL